MSNFSTMSKNTENRVSFSTHIHSKYRFSPKNTIMLFDMTEIVFYFTSDDFFRLILSSEYK